MEYLLAKWPGGGDKPSSNYGLCAEPVLGFSKLSRAAA